MDFGALLVRFATGTYTVTRTTRGTPVRGRVDSETTTTLTISASVSPADGDDLLLVPEGNRVNVTLQVFTSTQLYLGGQGATYEPDVITISGSDYRVVHLEPWQDPTNSSNTMYRALVSSTS